MAAPGWISVLAGLILLALVLLDVMLTVLHVEAESVVSNRFHRTFWRVLCGVTWPLVRARNARATVLSWGVPLMVVGTLILWVTGYIAGFGLVYLPVIADPRFFHYADPSLAMAVDNAFYFSAASLFTLGYGDVYPAHVLTRLMAAIEGGTGMLTISLAVAYVIAVYPFITRSVALATSLNQESAGRADGIVIAARYVGADGAGALGEWLRGVNDELIHMAQAHGFYPVLYYVRPRDVHASFARVLALVQGLVGTLRYGLDPVVYRPIVADPRLTVLEEGLLYTLHSLGTSMHLDLKADATESPDSYGADFAALREQLRQHGLTARSGDDAAAGQAYARFRSATDPYIRAYAHNLRYHPKTVWAVYSRWARGSALTSPDEPLAPPGATTPEPTDGP